jgi:hypothetical protein
MQMVSAFPATRSAGSDTLGTTSQFSALPNWSAQY